MPLGRKQNTNLNLIAPSGPKVVAASDEERDDSDEEDKSTTSHLSVKVSCDIEEHFVLFSQVCS